MTKEYHSQIVSIQPLTDSVLQVMVALDESFEYEAGQYIEIIADDGQRLAYSIANAPLGANALELHIGHAKDNPYSIKLLEMIRREKHVTFTGPHGDCGVHCLLSDKPIVLVAGGTGFAPIKAIIEQLLADSDQRVLDVYWGAKSLSDLYAEDRLKYWDQHIAHFSYTPLVSARGDDKRSLSKLITDTYGDRLSQHQFILAGPFDMVFAMRDAFLAQGLPKQQMFSDAFAYE